MAENKKVKEIKPLEKKQFSLDSYKAKNKLDDGVKDKPLEYIKLSPAFQKVVGLPGIPKGNITILRGHSNTGKSTALCEAVCSAQSAGILPVIIDTENSWSFERAALMGMSFSESINEVTGEVENYEGFFIYINNDHLVESFAKLRDKNADEAAVEDVASFINKCLDDQTKGELPYELLFCWDSVGTLNCVKGIESKTGNNQWIAGAIESEFRSILNYRIPASKKENKQYTNTMVVVNKVWVDNMGMGVLKNKGGNAFAYATRFQLLFGGSLSSSTKKLTATASGKQYSYGTQTKVKVEKNHITSSTYSGELVSTAHGFILTTEVESYKKEYKDFITQMLGVDNSIQLTYTEEEVNEDDVAFME